MGFRHSLQPPEMRCGGLSDWRDTHQALWLQIIFTPDPVQKQSEIVGQHADFLLFRAHIDLNKQARHPPGRLCGFQQRPGEFLPVQRLNDIEESDSILSLIGLQRPYKVQFQIEPMRGERFAPPGLRLLNSVLTKDRLACVERIRNLTIRLDF